MTMQNHKLASPQAALSQLLLLKSANLYHDIRDDASPSHETKDIRDPKESLLLQELILVLCQYAIF